MVYIGTDSGKVKPHGFYQACKVCSKNATPCTEREVDGTCVIDIMIDPKDNMEATLVYLLLAYNEVYCDLVIVSIVI